MKVTLTKNGFSTREVDIPQGVIKEEIYDYQDPNPYYKYFYISKSGKKKECKIKWV